MKATTTLWVLGFGSLLVLSGCGGGAGAATYTNEKKTEEVKFGSALVAGHYVYASIGCKVTCDMLNGPYLDDDKIGAACPGNWRMVELTFMNPTAPAYSQPEDVKAGTYGKTTAMRVQPVFKTKDNTGHLYNYSTAKTMRVDVAYSGQTATVNFDTSDSASSLKGTVKAQVCPKK